MPEPKACVKPAAHAGLVTVGGASVCVCWEVQDKGWQGLGLINHMILERQFPLYPFSVALI